MQTPEPIDGDLSELHALYVRLSHSAIAEERRVLTEAIILHPTFQGRLRKACGAVMSRCAGPPDLRGDVLQEATLILAQHLRNMTPHDKDLGIRHFGGWFRTVCYRACLKAWLKSRPLWLRSIESADLEILSQLPERPHPWETLIVCLNQVPDDLLRGILVDWAFGIPVTDTAQRYCLTRDAITKLRRRGRAYLRQAQARD